jgi:hypothetical protein
MFNIINIIITKFEKKIITIEKNHKFHLKGKIIIIIIIIIIFIIVNIINIIINKFQKKYYCY